MTVNEITLPTQKRSIHLLTLFLGLTFFGLIFYFRNSLEDFSLPFTYVFLGIGLLSFITGRLETFVLLLLIITSTVFGPLEIPTLSINIGDLYVSDILIILLLVSRLLKKVTVDVVVIPKPLGYPILVSILVGIFSFVYASWGLHVSTLSAGSELRAIVYLSLFFLVIYYVRTERQLRTLLLGIGIIGAVVAVLLVLQYVYGKDSSIVSGRVEILSTTEGKFADVTRVMVPGSSILLFSLNTLIAIYILKGLRRKGNTLVLYAIALLTLGLILTFTRIFWIMVVAAVVFLLIIARRRAIVYPRFSILIAGAGLVIAIILQVKVLNSTVMKEALFDRSISILKAPGKFKDDTLFMRYLESRYAWKKIVENPFLGIGLGNAYRPLIFGKIEYENIMGGTFLHNGYLATQMKMGLPGTIAFIWLMVAFFQRVRKRWRRIQNPLYRAVVVGITLSIVGMLIHNLTAAPFLAVFWVSIAAVGMGIIEKVYQFEGIS